jgi:hypothetical protein
MVIPPLSSDVSSPNHRFVNMTLNVPFEGGLYLHILPAIRVDDGFGEG